jgi:hypothetical protein
MRNIAALGLVLVAAIATPAFGQSFVGDWTATAHAPGVDASETLSVVKAGDGYAISAKLIDAPPDALEAGPGENIVLDGDKFSYTRTVKTPQGSLKITYSGVVSGDTFTGTVDMGFAQAPYTGVRIKSGK